MADRLDLLLYEKGLAPSRQKAKELILSGAVYMNGRKAVKPSEKVTEDSVPEIRGEVLPFVSRGGLKLKKALEVWPLKLNGKTCMDVGASTGGFTDCMLKNGAAKVFAVDVGTGQLHESLKNDPRVIDMERTNIREVTPENFGGPVDFISIDVSFISLSLVLPSVYPLLCEGGGCIALIKPQFEAGKANVGKKGVVKDRKVHLTVLRSTVSVCETSGFTVLGVTYSPIRGPEGNIEYLIRLEKGGGMKPCLPDLTALVEEAHRSL